MAKSNILSGKLPLVVIYIDWILVFFEYNFAISKNSFRAKGSPPVKLIFNKDLPKLFVNLPISSKLSSDLKVSGLSKSMKQKEQRALHLLVKKWTRLIGSDLLK